MSQDDMHVIAYRILKYLYECMRRGEVPDGDMLAADGPLMHIPESYRASVFEELSERGLIRGVTVTGAYGGGRFVTLGDPRITLDGVEYLNENSMMRKVANSLREAKGTIPGL